MKTWIMATDFSDEAENALKYAGEAAAQLGARIILFNSFRLPTHAANTILSAESVQQLEDHNLTNLEEKALELSARHHIKVDYESGLMLPVNDELNSLIKKYNADLVIMGMAPQSLSQDLFGNTTTAAIQKLNAPILAIPLGAMYKPVKRILFACDVIRGVHKKILEQVKKLASDLGAEVQVFYVQDKIKGIQEQSRGEFEKKSIKEGLEGVTHQYKHVESGAVIEEIRKEIIAYKADLLIMVPHKYGFWDSLIHRSRTRIMASSSDIPLLSIAL